MTPSRASVFLPQHSIANSEMTYIRQQLEALADSRKAAFSESLGIGGGMPVLGVSLPVLRAFGKRLARSSSWRTMLKDEDILARGSHEEILLRAFIIGYADMDTAERLRLLRGYIPLVNNWALCDCAVSTLRFAPSDYGAVWSMARQLLTSHAEYEVRFGAVMVLSCLKSLEHLEEHLVALAGADTSGFYAMMGVAWAYAELFKLDNGRVLSFLAERHSDLPTTRKALSKICDSLTTTDECRSRIREIRKTLK